jgi:hypothetical protein
MLWKFYIVLRNGNKVEIDEPVGWDSMDKSINRDEATHGMFFKFSEGNLEFTNEAYWIIKEEYINYLGEGNLGLIIDFSADENDVYENFYTGKFDFQRCNEICGENCSIKIGLENSSAELLIKNRQDIAVDLLKTTAYDNTTPLSNYNGLNFDINIPGKKLKLINQAKRTTTSNYDLLSDFDVNNAITSISGPVKAAVFIPALDNVILSELEAFAPPSIDDAFEASNYFDGALFQKKTTDLLKCSTGDFNISGKAKLEIKSDAGGLSLGLLGQSTLYIQKKSISGTVTTLYSAIPNITNTQYINSWDIDFSLSNVAISDDDVICFFVLIYFLSGVPSIASLYSTVHEETYFKMEAASLCDPSPCKMFFIHEAASRVIESITNNTLKFKSEYYGRKDSQPYSFTNDGEAGLRAITNGLQIRRAVKQDNTSPNVFISFKELFESLNAIDCIGMGIENNDVRFEPIKYFYNDDIIFTADNVANIDKSIILNRLFNLYSFGYDKWETEGNNGLDAIHTKRQYRTVLEHTDGKLEKICKLITDGYAIETTRRKFGISDDWRYDNSNFIFCLENATIKTGTATIEFENTGSSFVTWCQSFIGTDLPKVGDTIEFSGSSLNTQIYKIEEIFYNGLVDFSGCFEVKYRVSPDLINETISTPYLIKGIKVEIGNITSSSNFYDASTVINYRISPFRNAMKWFKWIIQGIKYLQSSTQVLFNSGDGNFIAKGMITGGVVYENTAIAENDVLEASKFSDTNRAKCFIVPEKVSFTYPLGIREFLSISANKYGLIKYRHFSSEEWSYGWLQSLKYMPESGTAEFTLTTAIKTN